MGCSSASTKETSNIKSTLISLNPQTESTGLNLNKSNPQSRNIKETQSSKSVDPEPSKTSPEYNQLKANYFKV